MKANRQMKIEGQTLVEVMITLLFVCISIIALIRFQNYLAYNNSLAQQQSEATILAEKQLETLRDFQVLNNQNPYTSYQGIASGNSNVNGVNATYSLAWTVTPYTNPTYKNIDVTVSWTDRYNVSQSVELTTQVAGVDPSTEANIM